jgi:hypothetical protein
LIKKLSLLVLKIMTLTNTSYEQNSELLNVKVGGTHSYH